MLTVSFKGSVFGLQYYTFILIFAINFQKNTFTVIFIALFLSNVAVLCHFEYYPKIIRI